MTESLEELRAGVSDMSTLAEYACLKAPSRKLEFLAVRVLLYAMKGREIQVGHEPSGRPFLIGESEYVSISHTRNYVAVGLHKTAIPGIDIEQYGDKVRRVRSRFVRKDELPEGEAMPEKEELYQLLLHWSAKETMFKVMNCTEVDFLRHLRIAPFRLSSSGILTGEAYYPEHEFCYRIHYLIHPDFVCTYCVGESVD